MSFIIRPCNIKYRMYCIITYFFFNSSRRQYLVHNCSIFFTWIFLCEGKKKVWWYILKTFQLPFCMSINILKSNKQLFNMSGTMLNVRNTKWKKSIGVTVLNITGITIIVNILGFLISYALFSIVYILQIRKLWHRQDYYLFKVSDEKTKNKVSDDSARKWVAGLQSR